MNRGSTTIHVVQHLAPGGLEALALNMLSYSPNRDNVLIVSLDGTREESIANWPRLAQFQDQLLFLNKPNGYSVKTLYELYKLFRTFKPSVVHTHHIGPVLYGSIAARLANIKVRIHTEHDAWHLSSLKHRSLQSLAIRIAKPKLVADAALVRDQVQKQLNLDGVTVIKNGIDCATFKPGSKLLARQALSLPVDTLLVGTAGRLEQVKGHDVLIHAICSLPKNVHLAIAGDGSERANLEALVSELGLSDRVTFMGLVNDMPRFYQSLDLFCLPSRSEGFPLSTLEAQSCGIPTVATKVGATEETLCPITSASVPSENPLALATSILCNLNEQFDVSPRNFVLKHNDIKMMIQAYHSLAEEKTA
ncbi:glycosyltransferase [Vibrio ouci]|uniref:Glycosyltransferase n=1 Tax=Vibrio ouci TaxID=2499078 RepID=A0A4Y8WHD9_9VIBR|nr:glycosyltransferase [Vibrio ouci]TFH92360.1 glycosyltransferase [Vibrio ouci]